MSPMARLLASVIFLGLAAANLGSCVSPGLDRCLATDHSLLQVELHAVAHSRARDLDRAHHPPQTEAKEPSTDDKDGTSAGLLEADGDAHALATEAEYSRLVEVANRTLSNITSTINDLLEGLEADSNLLVLGNHRLCAAEQKNGARVKTLMKELNVQALLQASAVEHGGRRLTLSDRPAVVSTGHHRRGSSGEVGAPDKEEAPAKKTEKGDDFEKSADTLERKVETLSEEGETAEDVRSKVKGEKAAVEQKGNASRIYSKSETSSVHSRVKAKNKDVPLANITAHVSDQVHSVEAVMYGIQKEENKNEVFGTEVSNRIQVLISLLETEVGDCQKDSQMIGFTSIMEASRQAVDVVHVVQQKAEAVREPRSSDGSDGHSVLEAKRKEKKRGKGKGKGKGKRKSGRKHLELLETLGHASEEEGKAGLDRERLELLLNARGPASETLTFANLTTLILEEVSGLEKNVGALVEEKNKLSVAPGLAHLDNLADNIDTEYGQDPDHLQLALQAGKQKEASLLQIKVMKPIEHRPIAKKKARQVRVRGHRTTRSAVLQKKQNSRDKVEKHKKKDIAHEVAGTEHTEDQEVEEEKEDQEEDEEMRSPGKIDFRNTSISGLTGNIDAQVTKLEADINHLRAERHQACWSAKSTLAGLETILGVLSTMEC